MHALSASELLDVWERGLNQPPARRALTLLSAACPEIPLDSLTRLSVGARDARLTTLREWIFGNELICLASCERCGEPLELIVNTADVHARTATEVAEKIAFSFNDYELVFRLPNSLDLFAIADCSSIEKGSDLLLERCISEADYQGNRLSIEQLPASVKEALVGQMAQVDKSGDIQFELNCPQCGHIAQTIFDIESFFWKEINAWANRVLREVHTLASTYGWSEAEILSMSFWRRQAYLSLIGA